MYRSPLARQVRASCLLLLTTQMAFAADRLPRVELHPFLPSAGVSEAAVARLNALAREELARHPTEWQLSPNPRDPAPFFAEGKRLLAALQLEEAKQQLELGVETAWANPLDVTGAQLIEAYLDLAATELRRGEEAGAKRAFTGLLRLAPGFRLPAAGYPPIFARELEKARRFNASAPRGALIVKGPEGAVAHVDGVAVGRVPATQSGLTYGQHLVTVELPGAVRTAMAVEIGKPETVVSAPFRWMSQPPLPVVQFRGMLDTRLSGELSARLSRLGNHVAVVGTVVTGAEPAQLSLLSAVYSPSANGYQLLQAVTVRQDLQNAPLELARWSQGLEAQLQQPASAVAMPYPLLPSLASEIAPAPKVALVPKSQPAPAVLALKPEEEKAAAVIRSPDSSVPWWVWVVGIAGVAAAAGGTYYGVSQATRPVTGTVSARW